MYNIKILLYVSMCMKYVISLSLSTMVTVAWPGLPTLILLGNEETLISICMSSLFSNISSSVIGILNEAVVTPAGNVTVYGPEL